MSTSRRRSDGSFAIADDALISGHRASHWTGVAPSIEEDLAFSTIAQAGVNHADLSYQILLGPNHSGQVRAAVDALGLGREPDDYRHAVLCERPPRDFAYTLARHWAHEHFDALRLDALAGSSDAEVAAVARKLRHELRYHLEHADHWFGRLAGGGDDAHDRLRAALLAVLPEVLGLLGPVGPGRGRLGQASCRSRRRNATRPMPAATTPMAIITSAAPTSMSTTGTEARCRNGLMSSTHAGRSSKPPTKSSAKAAITTA